MKVKFVTLLIMAIFVGSYGSSIMFVIDHSHSMSGLGNTYPGRDQNASRFIAVSRMIDTIYAADSTAKIGLVIFRECLFIDTSNCNYAQVFDTGMDAYIPMRELNYLNNGIKWKDNLKNLLLTKTNVGYNASHKIEVTFKDLIYQPTFTTLGNTNINIAFDAVKKAFNSSTTPKDEQYVIFIADGEPFPRPPSPDPFAFTQGIDVPTTFTLYFDTLLPPSFSTMTENIRTNGYSNSNTQSSAIITESNLEQLSIKLMDVITNFILKKTVISYPEFIFQSKMRKEMSKSLKNGLFFIEKDKRAHMDLLGRLNKNRIIMLSDFIIEFSR